MSFHDDPVEVTPRWKPEKSPGGIGQPKARSSQRFREKASPHRWREIRARKLGPCYVCRYLGVEQQLNSTLHHLVAKSLGGSDTEANCVPLCGTGTRGCHGLVERHDPDTCALLAAAVQKFDDQAYVYAVEKLGEDGWLRRYYVRFRCESPEDAWIRDSAEGARRNGASLKDIRSG